VGKKTWKEKENVKAAVEGLIFNMLE